MVTTNLVKPRLSVADTEYVLRKQIILDDDLYHTLMLVYPDGKNYKCKVSDAKVMYSVAYNLVFRQEAALVIDNILCYYPECFEKKELDKILQKLCA